MSEILLQKRKPSQVSIQSINDAYFPKFSMNPKGTINRDIELYPSQIKSLKLSLLQNDIQKIYKEQQGDMVSVKKCLLAEAAKQIP